MEAQTLISFRAANWRYRLATKTVNSGKHCKAGDDSVVRAAVAYLGRRSACVTAADRRRLIRCAPELHEAWCYFELPNSMPRCFLEAAILAGTSPLWSEERFGIAVGVRAWYEALFFDVASRLKNRAYIVSVLESGDTDRWYDVALKWQAYLGGEKALASVFSDGFEQVHHKHFAHKIQRAVIELQLSNDRDRLAAIARHDAMQGQMIGIDGNSLYTENLKAMLEEISFVTSSKETNDPYVNEIQSLGVELSDEELMSIENGGKLSSEVEEEIRGFSKAIPGRLMMQESRP